jgi:hypothetical protein
LTNDGKIQAEDLGTAFRKLYPSGEGKLYILKILLIMYLTLIKLRQIRHRISASA